MRFLIYCVAVTVLLAVASLANALEVQEFDGTRVDIRDEVGQQQWTLVFLWSTNCAVCETQKPMIESFHQDHQSNEAKVIGIALDGPAEQRAIEGVIQKTAPSYQNYIALDDVFDKQFMDETGRTFIVTPTYLLYSPDGALAGVHSGLIKRRTLEQAISTEGER